MRENNKRFRRSDWLSFGLRELGQSGPEALRIKTLCAAANKTIGSFYHHFEDHAAFIDALMEHWRQTFTYPVIKALDEIDDAHARAQELSSLSAQLDATIEVGVRLLASQNARAYQILEVVDKQRIAYVAKMYAKRFSVPSDEANALAKLEYAAFVGSQQLFRHDYEEIGPELSELLQSALRAKYLS